MPKEFKFPDLGEGITEGELVKWLVKEGDTVKEDQDVAEVETDKALVSIPSPAAGKIEKLHYKEGDKVKVGTVLLSYSDAEPAAEPPKPEKAGKPEEKKTAPKEAAQPGPSGATQPPPQEKSPKLPALATPHTRKLARELKVDIDQVPGSGPQGRITEEDVKKFATRAPTVSRAIPTRPGQETQQVAPATPFGDFEKYGPVQRIPIKGIRRKISEHMLQASQQAVMVTHIDEAQVDELLKIRQEKLKYTEAKGVKLTLLPFLMKACVIALRNYPYLNASLVGEEIVLKKYYNFGFAVDTEAGLLVPVVKNVEQKSIMRLAVELKELSEKARERSISLDDLRGHTFSITNIGSIGGRAFTPIIHYPDSAILGLGRTHEAPVVRDGEVVVANVLPLCLTFDHRVTDGATAARFVNEVIKYLKDPDLLLLDYGEP